MPDFIHGDIDLLIGRARGAMAFESPAETVERLVRDGVDRQMAFHVVVAAQIVGPFFESEEGSA